MVAKLSAKDISKLIKKGKAVIKTAGDRIIIAAMKGKDVFYFEEKGGKFNATIAAVKQSNVVLYAIDVVFITIVLRRINYLNTLKLKVTSAEATFFCYFFRAIKLFYLQVVFSHSLK